MESLKKFEVTIEGWLKPIPHLPTTWRKWLSENVWWITLVGVILSVIGLFGLLMLLLSVMTLFGATTAFSGVYSYAPVAYTGMQTFALFVQLLFLVATVVIMGMAIKPLKLMKAKGWDLMFLVFLIGIVSSVVSIVLNFNVVTLISGLIGAVISAAIGAYFLFELKPYFKNKKA